MTNTALLKEKIAASGYKICFIADCLGLSYYGLKKKIENETDFKAGEIQKLCNILGLNAAEKDEIFFCA